MINQKIRWRWKAMLTRNLPTMFNDTDHPMRFSSVMDRLFDEMVNTNRRGSFIPKMDVAETDKSFEITAVLPGMEKNDINVEFENNTLTVSGERRWEREEENGRKMHRVETGYGTFSRSLPLPDTADGENIQAEYKNGELLITIPKLKEKAGKKIKVK